MTPRLPVDIPGDDREAPIPSVKMDRPHEDKMIRRYEDKAAHEDKAVRRPEHKQEARAWQR